MDEASGAPAPERGAPGEGAEAGDPGPPGRRAPAAVRVDAEDSHRATRGRTAFWSPAVRNPPRVAAGA